MELEREVYRAMTTPMLSHINVGAGEEITIREVAELIRDVVGYEGRTEFDAEKADGSPRKLMDSAILTRLGWHPKVRLRDGIADTYIHFKMENAAAAPDLPP
jgi:GDP-L-fucose synthase